MKIFSHIIGIIGGICVVSGLVLMIVGASMGGNYQTFARTAAELVDIKEEYDENEYSDVTKLKLDLSVADVQIKTGDSLKIEGTDVIKNSFEAKIDGDTLVIQDKQDRHFFNLFSVDFGFADSTVVVYIPKSMKFEETDISVGAGVLSIDGLYSEKGDIEISAGELTGNHITFAEEGSIELSAGKLTLNDFSGRDLDVEVSLGHVEISGTICGDNNIDVSAGGVTLELDHEFGYSVDDCVGTVTINGDEKSDDTEGGNDDDSFFELNCSAGDITINN